MTVSSRLVCLFCLAAPWAVAAPRATELLHNQRVHFEPNRGQFGPGVRFAARTGDYHLLLTGRSAVLAFPDRRVEIELAEAAAFPVVEGGEPLPSRSDYFLGKLRAAVPHYASVRYRQAWPGIDVVYYGHGAKLEYDFVLQPGADPGRIRMRFHAAGRLHLTPDGDLEIHSGSTLVVQKKPVLYQQTAHGRRPVRGEYQLVDAETVAVRVGEYDPSRPLTIDPVIYGTFLGTGRLDEIVSVKIDSAGMVWVAGNTRSDDLAATGNAYSLDTKGATDVFVAQFDPAASGPDSLVYYTYLGGTGTDTVADMVLGRGGNMYLVGTTDSTDFPCTANVPQSALAGGSSTDAFVTVLNPGAAGTDALLFSTYLGGTAAEWGNGIAVDNAGAIYVIGTTQSTDYPLTSTGYAQQMWGTQDAFIAKIDPVQGWLVYSTYFGGDGLDEGRAITATAAGIVYVAGSTSSTQFPLEGAAYQDTLQGGLDVWMAKMDMTKAGSSSVVRSTYLGGSDLDEPHKIALDSAGSLLVTGYTMSTDFPVTQGAFRTTLAGNADVFVARLNFDAPARDFVQYATYLGGIGGEVAHDITTDAAGNIWVAGYTLSPDFPVTRDAVQSAYGFGVDSFVAELDPRRTGPAALLYSTYLGQDGLHVANSLAVRKDGSVWVAGYTGNGNLQVTGSAFQNVYSGGLSDGFLIAIK